MELLKRPSSEFLSRVSASLCVSLALQGCIADVDIDESIVDAPRLLAVRATPAEALPGTLVSYRALYASRRGVEDGVPLAWAYCARRPALAEPGPVSDGCVEGRDGELLPLGEGAALDDATLPSDACRLFGPDAPLPTEDEPAGRAADPDVTGGYHVPLRVTLPDDAKTDVAFFEHRVRCGLAGATPSESIRFQRSARMNANPRIADLVVRRVDGGDHLIGVDETLAFDPGERVSLHVAFPSCPLVDVCGDDVCGIDDDLVACAECSEPVGCGGAERYLRFEPGAGIVEERETLRVTWLATTEGFAVERTGIDALDTARETSNAFDAPTSGSGTIFIVARDDRGGVDWRTLAFTVD